MKSHTGHIRNEAQIEAMFSRIAHRYDLINHMLSVGLDIWWRKVAASAITLHSPEVLDVCCGTGDLTFAITKSPCRPRKIVACDFSMAMINIAKQKESRRRRRSDVKTEISWHQTDATRLPFADNSFDVVSCAFGLRNIPDISGAIDEMYRVLRPGGQICVLEFSLPKNRVSRTIYLLYFQRLLPLIAGTISGNFKAYKHLSESVRYWEREVDLSRQLSNHGFENIHTESISLGIVQLFTGYK